MAEEISVISVLREERWSHTGGGAGNRCRWCGGGGEPVLLVSDIGGGGSCCGVRLLRSRSGVLVSSFTMLSSSDEDSATIISIQNKMMST